MAASNLLEKSIAAWSVISNCIAMTAGTACWTSVWAVPAYGSVRPVRGPSQELTTSRRSVR
jgi:hypothetical protein